MMGQLHRLGERPHIGLGLGVEIGHRKLGAGGMKSAGAAIGDRMLIRYAEDEPFLAAQIHGRSMQRLA